MLFKLRSDFSGDRFSEDYDVRKAVREYFAIVTAGLENRREKF